MYLLDTDVLIDIQRGHATLCTFNAQHYSIVPGLTTEEPYTR